VKIGFIGAGVVAQTIARHVLPFGHHVVLSNTRGPGSLTTRPASGPSTSARWRSAAGFSNWAVRWPGSGSPSPNGWRCESR
jgi:3-hydroxyisobutyrate dehydrogenase-like beta-hydroxyacid dehydrogenase